MQANRTRKIVIAVVALGILGLVASAYAGWGRGWGGGYGPGACWGSGGGWGPGFEGPADQDELSGEELERLNQMRSQFFEETRKLRDGLAQKQLELRSELAKETPDEAKALKLQEEISALREQLAQKRLAHGLKLRKEFPQLAENGFGYGRGRGWGMGPGGRRGMGPGGMYGMGPGGYGMGYGHMGMGPGYHMGYGWGPMGGGY